MLKNKVRVFVDDVPVMALVDTGATISVMSACFKDTLGRKVLFKWNQASKFCGVSGEALHPVGVCQADVFLGGRVIPTEFVIIPQATHDVILGMDFLRECGATVDCRTGTIVLSDHVPPALLENPVDGETALCVCGDTIIPPLSTVRVPVGCSDSYSANFDANVEPVYTNCMKKNVLIPHCVVSIRRGRAGLWTVNCSTEPVMLPDGLKLAVVSGQHEALLVTELRDAPEEHRSHSFETALLSNCE